MTDPTGLPTARPPATPLVVVPLASVAAGHDPTDLPTAREPGAPFTVVPLPQSLVRAAPVVRRPTTSRPRPVPVVTTRAPHGALAATGERSVTPVVAALTVAAAWVLRRRQSARGDSR